MNINTNSWHYKLVKNTFTSSKGVPTSLCPYMRAVLYRVTFISGMGVGLILMFANLMFGPMVAWGLTGIWAYVASFFASIAFFGVILAGAGAVVFGGVWAWQNIENWWSNRKYDKAIERARKAEEDLANGIEPKAPNVLTSYVKAKHEQICPTLTFVKEEK